MYLSSRIVSLIPCYSCTLLRTSQKRHFIGQSTCSAAKTADATRPIGEKRSKCIAANYLARIRTIHHPKTTAVMTTLPLILRANNSNHPPNASFAVSQEQRNAVNVLRFTIVRENTSLSIGMRVGTRSFVTTVMLRKRKSNTRSSLCVDHGYFWKKKL